jgi:threonine aldolase
VTDRRIIFGYDMHMDGTRIFSAIHADFRTLAYQAIDN